MTSVSDAGQLDNKTENRKEKEKIRLRFGASLGLQVIADQMLCDLDTVSCSPFSYIVSHYP